MATMLPQVKFGKKTFFFDERLSELRNVNNPHDYIRLNEFEIALIKDGKGMKNVFPILPRDR